ncbi:MAG: guanine deaminase [Candidatus Cloacimonetes bacterium]|nr:guanine deaminase [Candidatus Cloacimonadota bacterium]
MRNILCNIISPLSAESYAYLPKHIISIEQGTIVSIRPAANDDKADYEDYSDYIALPGFIDLHVHLSQYQMRGMYEPALLPWLNKYVFPEEARSHDEAYASALAKRFFNALCRVGTTTSLIYTAPYETACNTAFKVAQDMGMRAMIGMTMMDMNSPKDLEQTTANSLETSFRLYEEWHGKSPLLDYLFAPRFAPTCSMQLMQEIGTFAKSHGAWIQTHLSENPDELQWVKELFGMESYTEVYEKAGLVTPRSIFGHSIHLSEKELSILKANDAKIAHCPDSNFFLKSGEYPMQRIREAGIAYGLGSDVGAGTTLNMLHHAKMMNYRQSAYSVLPANALYHITLGSAKLLGMDAHIGSLQTGKEADIVFLKPPVDYPVNEQSLSQLLFFGDEYQVIETLVAGRSVYHLP